MSYLFKINKYLQFKHYISTYINMPIVTISNSEEPSDSKMKKIS